jgi:hypothetical protein
MNSLSISTILSSPITSISLPQETQTGKWVGFVERASMCVVWGTLTGSTSPFATSSSLGSSSFKIGINIPIAHYNAQGQQRSEWATLELKTGLGGSQKTTVYEKIDSEADSMASIGGHNTIEVGIYDAYENLIEFTGSDTSLGIRIGGVTSPCSGFEIKLKLIELK